MNAAYSKFILESQLNDKHAAASASIFANSVQNPSIVIDDDNDKKDDSLTVASTSTPHVPEILIRVETETIFTGKLSFYCILIAQYSEDQMLTVRTKRKDLDE